MAHGAWPGLSCKPLAAWSWCFVIKVFSSYSWLLPTPKRVSVPRPPKLAIRASSGSFFFWKYFRKYSLPYALPKLCSLLYFYSKFNFVITCCLLTFCDPSIWPHGLVDGSWSLAWALMQASGCMKLLFCDQSLFKLQLAFPHPQEGLGTETP
jgi:hypothetical protein